LKANPEYDVDLVGENLYLWRANVLGPAHTCYEYGKFLIELHITPEYPFKPPRIYFKTPIYHPNISIDRNGEVSLVNIFNNWSPQVQIERIFNEIHGLLSVSMQDLPPYFLNIEIGHVMATNPAEFELAARTSVRKHALALDLLKS